MATVNTKSAILQQMASFLAHGTVTLWLESTECVSGSNKFAVYTYETVYIS